MASSLERCVARWTWVAAVLVAIALAGCSSSGLSCPAGQTACGNVCVDLQADALHCGACNTSCYVGATCTAGQCICPSAKPDKCGVECVDFQTSTASCGACGRDCGLGTCQAAACVCDTTPATVTICPPLAFTTGTCVDTATSGANCGGCENVCIAGEVCTAAACVCSSPKQICGTGSAAVCTNISTDPRNCGGCGTACASGQTCLSGTCQQSCAAGLMLCSGVCVDTRTDSLNCGGCAKPCLLGQSCSAGTCAASCTTLVCGPGPTCCQAPTAGNSCCGTSCPYQHKNFVGAPEEQSYFDCTPSFTYTLDTARKAASVWAPTVTFSTLRSCPTVGGSLCFQVTKSSIIGSDVGCGVWCYAGPFAGTVQVTQGTAACPCPTQQLDNWY